MERNQIQERKKDSRNCRVIMYEEQDIEDGIKLCETNLVGSVMTKKTVDRYAIEAAFLNILDKQAGFKVEEIEPSLFQFCFQKKKGMEKNLTGRPMHLRELVGYLMQKGSQSESKQG